MKKRFFSKSLYFDALKQTRILGILAIVVFIFISIISPIGTAISNTYGTTIADFFQVAPVLVAIPYIITPILCLMTFGFMNKRKSSDFYHSIADTRTCLFFSLFAAIITWVAIIMVSTLGTSVLVHLLLKRYFVLNMNNILINAFAIFVSSLYSAAIVSIAMNLTGTILTNVVVSALLLFLPDLLVALVSEAILSSLPILVHTDYFGNLLPVGFNVFNFLFYSYSGMLEIFNDLSRTIVTIPLSLIAIVISAILFKNRKSESAGYPTQNKYLQAAFRITCSFIVTLFACIFIFTTFVSEYESFNIEYIYIIALIYIAAILVYFICELITTKKFRNLPRTIPGFGIVLLLNVALIGVLFGAYNITLNFSPKASEVEYVRFAEDNYGDDIASYYIKKSKNIKITDTQTKEIVCDSLKSDINKIRNDEYYSYDAQSGYYTINKQVIICVNGKEYLRQIMVSESKNQIFADTLKSNKEFQKAYNTLPALGNKTYILDSENIENRKDAQRVYNLMRKEIAALDFESWYSMVNGYKGTQIGYGFYVSTLVGTENVEFYVPVYLELEESAREYIKLISNEKNENTILGIADDLSSIEHIGATITYGNNNYDLSLTPDVNEKTNSQIKEFISCLEPSSEINSEQPFAYVYIDYLISDDYGEWWQTTDAYFCYTGDIEQLLEEVESIYAY